MIWYKKVCLEQPNQKNEGGSKRTCRDRFLCRSQSYPVHELSFAQVSVSIVSYCYFTSATHRNPCSWPHESEDCRSGKPRAGVFQGRTKTRPQHPVIANTLIISQGFRLSLLYFHDPTADLAQHFCRNNYYSIDLDTTPKHSPPCRITHTRWLE